MFIYVFVKKRDRKRDRERDREKDRERDIERQRVVLYFNFFIIFTADVIIPICDAENVRGNLIFIRNSI